MRFWAFQILFITAPGLVFIVYAKSINTKIKKNEQDAIVLSQGSQCSEREKGKMVRKMEKREKVISRRKTKMVVPSGKEEFQEIIWTPRLRLLYLFHLAVKFATELVFFYFSYLLQQAQTKKTGWSAFWVPERYICDHGLMVANSACSQNEHIPCWISRPWEKTIFMLYQNIMAAICLLLLLLEILWVVQRSSRKGWKELDGDRSRKRKSG